jgi:tight adherence protein C
VTAMVLAGALFGAAVWFLGWTALPARTDHIITLGRLDAARAATTAPYRTDQPATEITVGVAGWQRRGGQELARWLERRGAQLTRLRQDLALLDRGLDDHLGALIGLFAATLVGALLLAGCWISLDVIPISATLILPTAVLIAASVVAARHHDLTRAGATRRRQFRRALSAYLELVARSLMGGTGVPEALPAAASIGSGWPFRLISDTLDRARAIGSSAWFELGALGERIGVDELRDLATALALVGQDGARIAATLIARASTLRRREIADIDGRAKERDTSMRVAMVCIFFGFLIFVLYPALTNVLTT